jgi:hypothetical protein
MTVRQKSRGAISHVCVMHVTGEQGEESERGIGERGEESEWLTKEQAGRRDEWEIGEQGEKEVSG